MFLVMTLKTVHSREEGWKVRKNWWHYVSLLLLDTALHEIVPKVDYVQPIEAGVLLQRAIGGTQMLPVSLAGSSQQALETDPSSLLRPQQSWLEGVSKM